jgi:hypothetical protein
MACICGNLGCVISYGSCHCGCGEKTKIAIISRTALGWIRGMPTKYLNGHNGRIGDGKTPQERRHEQLKACGRCVTCGGQKEGNFRLCDKCRAAKNKKRRKGMPLCKLCGARTSFVSAKYCDTHRTLKCETCKKVFVLGARSMGQGQKAYCSQKCYGVSMRKMVGDKARHWQGGKTRERCRIRGRLDYREWRDQVFKRDRWTCQKCGKIGGDLHAHHVKPFAKYPELRTVVFNGLTLCLRCHRKLHRMERQNGRKTIGNRAVEQRTLGFLRPGHTKNSLRIS